MKKIGVLSDTHRFLGDEMVDFLRGVDEIWHAGDVGSEEVIKRLENIAPVKAVFGNIDEGAIRFEYPEDSVFTVEDTKVYITHIGGYPGKYAPRALAIIEREKPAIFISGHSHILKVMNDDKRNLLHINPGAAGKIGLHKHITAVRFEIDGKRFAKMQVFEKVRKSL